MPSMRIPSEFCEYKATVEKCSYDEDNNVTLIRSQEEMVDYDKVKYDYAVAVSPELVPCSVDGLFLDEKDEYILVEFKAGVIEIPNILKKAYDSAFILAEKKTVNVSWLRKKVEFILVFNPETAFSDPNQKSRYNMMRLGTKYSTKKIEFFQKAMRGLKGFIYKNVSELTADEFSDKYLKI